MPDQICVEFLEHLVTFDKVQDQGQLAKLSQYIQNLWTLSAKNHTAIVLEDTYKQLEIEEYFEWMNKDILKRMSEKKYLPYKADIKYSILADKIIDEFKEKTDFLTLLHSDFNESNIGLLDGEILLFDSGYCKFLYGHKYHDITRFLLYYREGIIFQDESINPRVESFVQALDFDYQSEGFQKFFYLQSLLVYKNPFVTRVKEIADYLYQKLV